jgi:CheY-like chemotaxis protein
MFEHNACSILLIEDTSSDVDLFQRAMQKTESGLSLNIARDGETALAFIDQWQAGAPTPNLILLDLHLPKMSGFEVLKAYKTHPRYRVLPVVILTSSDNQEDIRKAYLLGANSYIIKNTNFDQFSADMQLTRRYWCRDNIQPA